MDPQPVQPAQDLQQQVAQRLKDATNVLVTVSNNPSVDQLAAAIGFTLVLNKLKKHGTAVFSGKVPSIIEFLEPEKTLEKDTNSLRDFIIALDKAKADKLRYKIEDKYVKIFITPYKTSITDKDLEFSQGDFNVDVVVALGVKKQAELDQAIVAHGRILHDATVIAINKQPGSDLGNLNLNVPDSSSLSEIMVNISQLLKGQQTDHLFDQQIATAFLTGIVAETDRFSNDKTTPATMKAASVLMEAGANQHLIATKLEPPPPPPPKPQPQPPAGSPPDAGGSAAQPDNVPKPLPPAEKPPEPNNDGSLTIPHGEPELPDLTAQADAEPQEEPLEQIHIDDQGTLKRLEELKSQPAALPQVQPPTPTGLALPSVEKPPLPSQPAAHTLMEEPPHDPATAPVLGDVDTGQTGTEESTTEQSGRSFIVGSEHAKPISPSPPSEAPEAGPKPPPVPPPITPVVQPPAGPQDIQDTAL